MRNKGGKLELKQIGLIIGTLYLLLILPSTSVALFSLLNLLIPVAVIIYIFRYGAERANKLIITAAIPAVITAAIINSFYSLTFSFCHLPLGYVLADSARRNDKPVISGCKGVITLGICIVLYGLIFGAIDDNNVYLIICDIFNEGFDELLIKYKSSNAIPPDMLYSLERGIKQLQEAIPFILPSFISMVTIFVVTFSMAATNLLLAQKDEKPWAPFRYWSVPDKLIWILIGSGALLATRLFPFNIIGLNLIIILCFIYLIQGFSIFSFFIERWNIPSFFRFFIYITVLFQTFGTAILITLGISNVWLNYRNRMSTKDKSNDNDNDTDSVI